MLSTAQMLLPAATARVEVPVDGSTGVWLKEGATVISSAMKMTGVTVTSGQTQYTYNRGVTVSGTITSGGTATVYSGGEARQLTIAGGYCFGSDGARINSATITAGSMRLNSGVIASGVSVISGGTATISAGASGYGVYVSCATYAAARLYAGGYVSGAVFDSNVFVNITGEVVDNISVVGGGANVGIAGAAAAVVNGVSVTNGIVNVSANKVISSVVLAASGRVAVSSGGTAAGVTISSGGYLQLNNGGSASGVTVDSLGSMAIYSGGTALAVTSNAGATVTVAAGGYIEYVTP